MFRNSLIGIAWAKTYAIRNEFRAGQQVAGSRAAAIGGDR